MGGSHGVAGKLPDAQRHVMLWIIACDIIGFVSCLVLSRDVC